MSDEQPFRFGKSYTARYIEANSNAVLQRTRQCIVITLDGKVGRLFRLRRVT